MLDLLVISVTHMRGTVTVCLPNGSLLVYSGRADGHKRQGVGLTLSKRIKNSLISYTPVSQRVITARLHSRHINISVVVAYAPTEGSCDSDKDEFYQQLEDTLSSLPRYDIKLLLGDFNLSMHVSGLIIAPGLASLESIRCTAQPMTTVQGCLIYAP